MLKALNYSKEGTLYLKERYFSVLACLILMSESLLKGLSLL